MRPASAGTKLGRVGAVGLREIRKNEEARTVVRELSLHNEDEVPLEEEIHQQTAESEVAPNPLKSQSADNLEVGLRQEAYTWPRLVFAPLKKSGHIILDACTAEGTSFLIF